METGVVVQCFLLTSSRKSRKYSDCEWNTKHPNNVSRLWALKLCPFHKFYFMTMILWNYYFKPTCEHLIHFWGGGINGLGGGLAPSILPSFSYANSSYWVSTPNLMPFVNWCRCGWQNDIDKKFKLLWYVS